MPPVDIPRIGGRFPGPDSGMILSVKLAEVEKSLWVERLELSIRTGHIVRKKLESPTWRLPYSQTSVFGRFGMCMMQPLFRKLNAAFYLSELSDSGRAIFRRWEVFLRDAKPRRAISRDPIPGKIIYKDAASETVILAIFVFGKRDFGATGFISDAYREVDSDELLAFPWGPFDLRFGTFGSGPNGSGPTH